MRTHTHTHLSLNNTTTTSSPPPPPQSVSNSRHMKTSNLYTWFSLWMMIGRRLAVVMTSQLGLAAVSESVQDGVSSVEGAANGCLHSASPRLQLRTILQYVSASAQRLHRHTHTHTQVSYSSWGGDDQYSKPSERLTCISSQTARRSATVMSSPQRND